MLPSVVYRPAYRPVDRLRILRRKVYSVTRDLLRRTVRVADQWIYVAIDAVDSL
jgi:hypothetical protein